MIGDKTGGVHAADSGTRVPAVLADAGQVPGTLGVDHALRLTLYVGVAGVVADAGAAGHGALLAAVGIDAARGWVARLDRSGWADGA